MEQKLTDLPNISKVNAAKLEQAGITTPEELRRLGAREALVRVRMTSDPGACCNMLYGLEGAIRGIRWHDLPQEVKADLREFHRGL